MRWLSDDEPALRPLVGFASRRSTPEPVTRRLVYLQTFIHTWRLARPAAPGQSPNSPAARNRPGSINTLHTPNPCLRCVPVWDLDEEDGGHQEGQRRGCRLTGRPVLYAHDPPFQADLPPMFASKPGRSAASTVLLCTSPDEGWRKDARWHDPCGSPTPPKRAAVEVVCPCRRG